MLLKRVNCFIEGLRRRELQIVCIGDASFKNYEKAVGGVILLSVNQDFTRTILIYWMTK